MFLACTQCLVPTKTLDFVKQEESFLSLGIIQGKIGMAWKYAGKAIGDDVLSTALPSQGCIIFLGHQGTWNWGVI